MTLYAWKIRQFGWLISLILMGSGQSLIIWVSHMAVTALSMRPTLKASVFEHRNSDYSGYINIADPDNVRIDINGTQYQVASYGSEGQLLNADGDKLIDQIRADVGFSGCH